MEPRKTLLTSVSFLVSSLLFACTDAGFKGSGGKPSGERRKPANPDSGDGLADLNSSKAAKNGELGNDYDQSPLVILPDSFQGGFIVKPLSPDSITTFWAVTAPGNAYWFRLEGDKVAESKKWTGLQSSGASGGSRTFVTEMGVVIARTGGFLYWIDPAATPEGAISQEISNHYQIPNTDPNDRACIVSYRKDRKRYVGIGWGRGNFVEYPMDTAPPYAPQWGSVSGSTVVPNVTWGYSCYIDQVRLIFYSQWVNARNGIGAVDLKTLQPTDPSGASNAKFSSQNLSNLSRGTSGTRGSYAINGDSAGNVFNGSGAYTLANNRDSRTVWGASGDSLWIVPQKCLTSEPNCLGHVTLPLPGFRGKLPLSSLPDGRMIGMKRQTNGQVNLFKLRDKTDFSKGVDIIPIAELEGDPYMYTDFTGSMLYVTKSVTTFELDTVKTYDTAKISKKIGFTWVSRSVTDVNWTNIKFEIACYASTTGRGEFETVETIKNALQQSIIMTDSCTNKTYDRVDIRLTQLEDDDTLMNVGRVQVTAYQ